MKMFLTQINGALQRVHEKEQETIEDSARLLSQAIVGQGKVHLIGIDEMDAVVSEAINGSEPLQTAIRLDLSTVTDADRVVIATRYSNDKEAIHIAQILVEKHIPFVVIAGKVKEIADYDLSELADVFVNTSITRPLLPGEDGERFGFPSAMVALFLYHCIQFSVKEFLEDYL